ncbi:hypothetical protein YK48G_01240 [Lentilactobacillus fungorum]|uniref:Integrase n=1 Tax=Lentilactobacillus fungorum TaxID=2201250 RepID=A0ABQ3VYE6_9LACO|nr:hypothetical protein YK48G_01240 [Lentilactobacillus fungorum]
MSRDGYYYYSFEIGRKDGKRRRVERSAGNFQSKQPRSCLDKLSVNMKVVVKSQLKAI